MMYPLTLVDDRVPRAALIEHLETRGVETRYLLPLINQPIYRATFGDLDAEYPIAARLNERAFYVGCHPDMTDEDADHVVAALDSGVRA
jgi:dTDP-4-amino-4,6-dideoxygalactose transaminase